MASKKISDLPLFTGDTGGIFFVVNNSGQTQTFKVDKERVFLGFSDGTSGTSGIDGTSGTSGIDGTSGTSGIDGTSGTSGIDGTSGTSGIDGTSGTSGIDGTSGTSGSNGTSGSSGTSGFGIITGGTTGQLLRKINSVNYNTEWADNVVPYYIQAGRSIELIGSNITTPIANWSTNVESIGGAWNATTGVFTCQRAGYYSFSAAIGFSIHTAPINSEYNISIAINGFTNFTSACFRQSAENVIIQVPPVQGLRFLNVGDTISFRTFHNSGGNRFLVARTDVNIMTIQELPNQIIK